MIYNGALFAVCLTNLMANNFVLKGGEFYRTQLVTSDLLASWILWSALLLPLWIKLAADALSFHVPARLLAGIAALSVVSIIVNFPFSALDLSAAPPWVDLWRSALRDGIVQPSALLLMLAGCAGLFRTTPSAQRVTVFVLISAACSALLKLALSGPALPRLEDETAYHLQSLVFQTGSLKAALIPGPAAPAMLEALRLPFVGQDGLSYFSLHLHGWPFVLSLFGVLSPFANLLLSVLNVFLFQRLIALHMPAAGKWAAAVSLAIFSLSPLLLFLSGTFMAHTFSLTLCLLLIHSHERITSLRSLQGNMFYGAACALLAGAAMLARPQALPPLLVALLASSFLQMRTATERAIALVRALALLGGGAAGFLAMNSYAENFPGFPVYSDPCNAPGFGPGHGCFPTYGTFGHTLQKTLLNMGDLAGRWNQELAPGGLPIALLALLLFLRHWRTALRSRSIFLYACLLAASIGQFGLFFHNGGESYHGRYLADSAFSMAMLVGLLLHVECSTGDHRAASLWPVAGRMIVAASFLLAVTGPALQIRGEYFHAHMEPFRTASRLAPVQNAVIVLTEPDKSASVVKDEFTGLMVSIPRKKVQTYLNLGYGTLAATAVRIGVEGIPEDASGNLLLGEISKSDAALIGGALRRPVYILAFKSFEPVTRSSRFMRFWRREEPTLLRLDE